MKKFIIFILLALFFISCGTDNSTTKDDVNEKCSKTNLTGVCENSQKCVEGSCQAVCSKDVLDGYCSDNKVCVEGNCQASCSKDVLDGYCSDNKICVEGSCQNDMSNITVNLIDKDGTVLATSKTDNQGKFEISKKDLTGLVKLSIVNNEGLIFRKRPGRTRYADLSVSNKSGGKLTTKLSDIILEQSLFSGNNSNVDILAIKRVENLKYNLDLSGQLDIYECIPKKDVGEPVTGAEIFIAQDPNDEPIAEPITDDAKTKTDDDGNFCFGKDCSGIKISVKFNKANNDKGGFAIGGYRLDKANNKKSGFAVGGYRMDKDGKQSGFHLELADLDIMVFATILSEIKDTGKYDITKFYIESDKDAISIPLKVNGSLKTWNYTCK